MPEEGLPASLSLIEIEECPLLKRQWKRKRGKEWLKTAHVPNIKIDRRMDSKAKRLARGRTFLLLYGRQRLDDGNNLSS
ncbi:hypothetical protein CJ030_MR0G020165 [Morella rubra]|uniref:Uncharacterized protein n=1 Tax=Morella rubra TaxID=262757 RepID=A0A6A1UIH5_9ROSI|nr:hypothetical protein CJ030_MR0G020165 [Morella rubra]